MDRSGHHLYCDSRDKFNELVLQACTQGEKNDITRFDSKKDSGTKQAKNIELDLEKITLDNKPSLHQD